jgi:hypothetical protein
MRKVLAISLGVVAAAIVVAHGSLAQSRQGTLQPDHTETPAMAGEATEHSMHSQHHAPMSGTPTLPGQDAFGAISEVVALLDADPHTDWSRVDLERLRQHLIDMNEVVLRAQIAQHAVPGGLVMNVTGSGRTERAIRAMLVPHAAELDQLGYVARTETIPRGVRLTVIAKTDDARAVARLRGLGFIGLLAEGAHHAPHHLAMARGDAMPGHAH